MGKNNFYVVTVGKDVGVFGKWLQVSQVRTGMNCEGYETKEEAMKAFDEAMANGFVKISGSFDRPYQSPRIYPPLDCPPYSCGPASAVIPTFLPPTPTSVCKLPSPSISPSSHIPPSSPIRPTLPVQRSSTPPPSLPPSVFEHASFGDIPGHAPNVTIRPRSPKKGKPETKSRCGYCPKRNQKIQTTIEKDGSNNIKREQKKGRDASPSMSGRSSSAKGKELARQQYEVNIISSESESDDDYDSASSLVGQKAPITPRRAHITMSVQSAHRSSTTRAKSVLRTLPPTANISSSSTSASRYGQKANKSPSRSKPNIVIDISDVESYPSDSDSDEDSSGPEDVTPLRTRLLLSPLTSPVFSNTALIDATVNSIQPLRSTSSSPRSQVSNSPKSHHDFWRTEFPVLWKTIPGSRTRQTNSFHPVRLPMDFSSDLSLESYGSRLLSESPMLPSASSSHADLSISELSLSDRPSPSSSRPFSLLARPASPSTPVQTHPSVSNEDDDQDLDYDDGETTQRQVTVDNDEQASTEEREQAKRTKAKLREDKLQSDAFVLRKLNAAFSSFNEALDGVGDANEARPLMSTFFTFTMTDLVVLLASEEFSRLISDEDWEGAEQDEMIIQREVEERIERERRESEERALAEQRERERLEREAKERQEREERERIERERKERAASRGGSGVRGVRGTRASTRGMRGSAPSTMSTRGFLKQQLTIRVVKQLVHHGYLHPVASVEG
ncbi:hypothetical protein GGU10DRAFT_414097 [Lentinula aff. detonsa]|uniref:Uncharacterized protein n=1 Tax=Lentinula aff. detonsa TaxID=2804958 RepID=A0AA38U0Y3_9AGAR|nr:hypothetical protein GGU10DRAFT_414097 [Lentinula aff. detonsa]